MTLEPLKVLLTDDYPPGSPAPLRGCDAELQAFGSLLEVYRFDTRRKFQIRLPTLSSVARLESKLRQTLLSEDDVLARSQGQPTRAELAHALARALPLVRELKGLESSDSRSVAQVLHLLESLTEREQR